MSLPTQWRGASVRLIHNPAIPVITALFNQLDAAGVNAISVIPHHYVSLTPGTPTLCAPPRAFQIPYYVWPDIGQDPAHPFHNTPDLYLTQYVCRAAKARGWHVLLKPHIDSYEANWRGDISVAAHREDWTWGYRNRLLLPYMGIAETVGCDLSLGCELYTVTKELGAAWWLETLQWVRAHGFSGPVTYCANWGVEADAEYHRLRELWPHLSYIGVDAYFPLVPPAYPAPLTAALVAGRGDPDAVGWHRTLGPDAWYPRIDDDLHALAAEAGKPLVFTEVGYSNWRGTLSQPWQAPSYAPPDPQEQTWGWQAFADHWRTDPAVAGWYAWEAWLERPFPAPVSHDLLDNPAAAAAAWAP